VIPPFCSRRPTTPRRDGSVFDGIKAAIVADRYAYFKDFFDNFYTPTPTPARASATRPAGQLQCRGRLVGHGDARVRRHLADRLPGDLPRSMCRRCSCTATPTASCRSTHRRRLPGLIKDLTFVEVPGVRTTSLDARRRGQPRAARLPEIVPAWASSHRIHRTAPGQRRRPAAGQYLTPDFPVLSAGPTPKVRLDDWEFTITTETGQVHAGTGPGCVRCPPGGHGRPALRDALVEVRHDLEGVSLDDLFENVETAAEYAVVHSYGGYTTNLPLEDLLDGQAWIAYTYDGEDLTPEHGGPAACSCRTCTCGRRQVGAGHHAGVSGRAGVLGEPRLPPLRRPMARAAYWGD